MQMKACPLSLEWWQTTAATTVPLGELKEDPRLQPRAPEAIPVRDRITYRERSAAHVLELTTALQIATTLAPLLVAEVDGVLYVVDGHHRLAAYRRASRTEAPVRVAKMTMAEAIAASKLVNCGQATLQVHNEQKREMAWQWLAEVTQRGAHPYLPPGVSLRDVEAYFGHGVSKDTIQNMLRQVAHVQPDEYSDAAKDPGTGWPRWRYVRGPKGGYGMGNADQQREKRISKAAERTGKFLKGLVETLGPEGAAEVFRRVEREWHDDMGDREAVAQSAAAILAHEQALAREAADTSAAEF
ncbi:ParB/RepB/Spo0J family partition protein [Luteimonas lutimaris]|uniref:ParB-like N-terminal domain-containing protein n=1 Tax=Luteimonas lutimaris TaxID=698645 RepID=A0ABP7MKM8_9GAMM